MDTALLLEAILFYRAEPLSEAELARATDQTIEDVRAGLAVLAERLLERGVRLVREGDRAALVTAPEVAPVLERMTKEELSRDLSKAAIETLSIVLYRGPVSRSEIDHIRGVNSSFILRSLLMRGLVDKEESAGARTTKYRASIDLLAHLGVTSVDALPGFQEARAQLAAFEQATQESDGEETLPEGNPVDGAPEHSSSETV